MILFHNEIIFNYFIGYPSPPEHDPQGGTMNALNAISNLTEFLSEPIEFMQNLARDGETKSLRIGPKRFVFVFDPESAHEILIKKSNIYIQNRTVFDRIQPVTGKKGLVQLSGQESQLARAKSRPMFATASLDSAGSITEAYCDDFLQKLEGTKSFDVTEEMTFLILRTALTIFLGIDSTELASQIGDKFLRLNYLCGLRMRSLAPAPLLIPTFKNREMRALQSEIRTLITKQLNMNGSVPKAFQGDAALIDHCMTFLFAGHETTASSLTFTLLLLAQNPQYQKAIAEGDESMALCVYKESLRLFPPAYMLAREASHDDDLLGMPIRKSDQVMISISQLHRNPRFFARPDDFFPERFQEKLRHPFSFVPFGAGAKSCVGERLAYLEASIVLKKICQKFQLSFSLEPIKSEPLITLHPLPNQHIYLQARNGESHGAF